jgi:hypothetical protein
MPQIYGGIGTVAISAPVHGGRRPRRLSCCRRFHRVMFVFEAVITLERQRSYSRGSAAGMCRKSPSRDLTDRPLARRCAMAYVLAGGRGSRLYGSDRQPRQARRLFRRQVSRIIDFALSNCDQLRHPPHRRRDAVQGALA